MSADSSSPSALRLRDVSTAANLEALLSTRQKGLSIGRYVVEGALAYDGVGSLYAAYDPKLERKVALRVIPTSGDDGSAYSRARLLRETRSVARLRHPNVISILDVGATPSEMFIAMEMASGETVDQWLDRKPRAWAKVLHAFVQAGRGMAEAHRAGFVHGDFTAKSILRTLDGRVLVTDFGLIRARKGPDGETNPGTDTRIARDDQHAYCSALYEALFDEPAPSSSRDLEELERVRQSDVPRRVQKVLSRGLSRHERYPDMDALLRALAPSPSRKVGWVAAGAGIFGAGLLAAYAMSGGANESTQCPDAGPLAGLVEGARQAERDATFAETKLPFAADSSARVSARLTASVQEWSDAADVACAANDEVALACLAIQERRIRALADVLAESSRATVEHAVAATLALPPGRTCTEDPVAAAATIRSRGSVSDEERLARAQALYAVGLHDEAIGHAQPLRSDDVPAGLAARTHLLLGAAQSNTDAEVAALRSFENAADAAQRASLPDVEADARIRRARVLGGGMNRVDEAWEEIRLAVVALETSTDVALRGAIWTARGELHLAAGNTDAARGAYAEAATAYGELGVRGQLEVADVEAARGEVEVRAGDYDASMLHFRRIQATRTELLGLSHPEVAQALIRVAGGWIGQGELVAARDTLETAAEILREAYGLDHEKTLDVEGRLATLMGLTGRVDESLELFERVLQGRRNAFGPNSREVGDLMSNQGIILVKARRFAEAKQSFEQTLGTYQVLGDEDGQSRALVDLATIALQQEDAAEAERLVRKAIRLRQDLIDTRHPGASPSLLVLGKALEAQSRWTEARTQFELAHEITTEGQGEDHLNAAYSFAGLGRVALAEGDSDEAAQRLSRALRVLEAADYDDDLEVRTRLDLAKAQHRGGHRDTAMQTARDALQAARRSAPHLTPTVEAWLAEPN